MFFDRFDHERSIEEAESSGNWKTEQIKKDRNKINEDTSKPSQKKACFVNKTTQTSRATSNNSNSSFNAYIPYWIEASSSEEEDIVMRNLVKKLILRL